MTKSERASLWNKENKLRRQEISLKYDSLNREKKRAYNKAYRLQHLEELRFQFKNLKLDNRELYNSYEAKRRALKRKAYCTWGNGFFIKEIYALAKSREKATGIKWEVDHIIPLQHKLVCGLHNEFNLQVIPQSINRIKHNKWEGV
jgi:5-methylcytosine-specific restriction endonuclease McrA